MIFCLKNLFSSLMRGKDAKAPKPAAIGVIRVDVVLRAMRKHVTNPEARPPPARPVPRRRAARLGQSGPDCTCRLAASVRARAERRVAPLCCGGGPSGLWGALQPGDQAAQLLMYGPKKLYKLSTIKSRGTRGPPLA